MSSSTDAFWYRLFGVLLLTLTMLYWVGSLGAPREDVPTSMAVGGVFFIGFALMQIATQLALLRVKEDSKDG